MVQCCAPAPPCRPSDRFPEVQRRRAELAAGEKALRDLLPAYRRQLNISNLQVGWGWAHAWRRQLRRQRGRGGGQVHVAMRCCTAPCPQFVSLHNVGDYLLEVPMDLASRAPKDWPKVCAACRWVGTLDELRCWPCPRTRAGHASATHVPLPVLCRPRAQVNATKKFVRYRPPEVAAGLQRVEVAKEHLTVGSVGSVGCARWHQMCCARGGATRGAAPLQPPAR